MIKRKMKNKTVRLLLNVFIVLAVSIFSVHQISAADNSVTSIADNPHILFLSSYGYEWESIPKQLSAITDKLNGYATIDYVFMDTKRLEYDDVKSYIHDDVLSREEKDHFDYVILADDSALKFALEYRNELFSGTPIVFEGINHVDVAEHAATDPMITGIVETFPLSDTIKLAKKINPDATKVVAISDDTVSGKGSTEQFMNCSEEFLNLDFSVIDCSKLTIDEIGNSIAACDSDTILVYLMMTNDVNGNHYSHAEAVEYASSKAAVPIYKADELGMGDGILGGVVVSYYDIASDAASIVLDLMKGGNISEHKLQTAKSYCEFDAAVMKKYKIKKSDITAAYKGDIKFINEEESFFDAHSSVLIPSGIIIGLLTGFLIFGLIVIRNKKKMMATITDNDRILNSILDNIPGGIEVWKISDSERKDARVLYVSAGIPKLTGRSMEEYRQLTKDGIFNNTIYKPELPEVQKTVWDHIRKNKSFYLNIHLLCRDGSLVFVSMKSVWAYNAADGCSVYYTLLLDITQQEQAQKAEQEAVRAKASDAAKTEFLSRMSHDIRTPLNAVLGFASLAGEESGLSVQTADYLNKIEVSGKYLLSLINDVLDMSKIGSGKMTLHTNSIYGPDFLQTIVDIYGTQASEKGVTLVTDFSEIMAVWVVIDSLRVQQIYANLLSNAIKFSESGTTIYWIVKTDQVESDRLHTVSVIRDQGIGMSKEFMTRMFQPFEQVDSEYAASGTGLGLSIVQSLIAMMGGTLDVKSEPGKGSEFVFELDFQIGQPQEKPQVSEDMSDSLKGKHILLCEDNQINADLTRGLLEKTGCVLDWMENGQLGLKRFEDSSVHEYAAILMDIRMPVMDGLTAARKIRLLDRADAKTIPIITMSANAFDEDVALSMEAGMNVHITKPIDPKVLYNTLAVQIHESETENTWHK